MRQLRASSGIGMSLAILVCASGCATGRFIALENRTPPPEVGIASGDRNLDVTIDSVAICNGNGSWLKSARWDEYVLTIRNLSEEPVIVSQFRLIDPRGLYIEAGVNPWQLEKRSEQLIEEYQNVGVIMVTGTAATAVTTAATAEVATTGVISTTSTLAPLLFLVGPALVGTKEYMSAKDREQVEDEFLKRQLGISGEFTLASHAVIKGSAFFPIVPNPQTLVITYRVGDSGERNDSALEVPLEQLKGLHVKPGAMTPSTAAAEEVQGPNETPVTPARNGSPSETP